MKKILSLVVIFCTIGMVANAQRVANIKTFIQFPNTDSVTTINCVDSYKVYTGFVNKGPDNIYPTDTIAFWDSFSDSSSVWYDYGDTIKVNDTFVAERGYFKKADLNILFNAMGGATQYAPFTNDNYYFSSTFLRFGLYKISTAVMFKDSSENQEIAPVTINCATTGLNNVKLNKTVLSVYPNPALDRISFKTDFAMATEANVQITDVAGRVVKSVNLGKQTIGQKTFDIDIQYLNKGMYYIQLVTDDTKSVNKFIKN